MAHARYWHTATVLTNGKVLIVGGDVPGASRSAELYDPSTQAWTTAGSLNHPRARFHTISSLLDGKLLVAGGSSDTDTDVPQNSAELYDPTTGDWTTIPHMYEKRILHTASTLSNGKVLIVGGKSNDTLILNSTELYDPSIRNWTRTSSMTEPRMIHTASVLPNGKVLVVGGSPNGFNVSNTCELYDPSTGRWTTTGSLNEARAAHIAITLLNGKVLVVGGVGENYGLLSITELYDPLTGMWTITGSMKYPRCFHAASLLPDGNVLVVGGDINSGDEHNITSSSELYNSSTGMWTSAGEIQTPRELHAASLLNNGHVLVTGGDNLDTDALRTAEIFISFTNTLTSSNNTNNSQLSHKPFILTDAKNV
jgi:N-acetylneuraminic acid mutarotase